MKAFIAFLLLTALLGIMFSLSVAQQNQSMQKSDPEIEALKKRISVLESKLQTVENVEKMELAAKLAEAQAKLANAEFGKFERELRDSNDGWLMKWNAFFLGVLAVIGVALWFSVKSLIADRVEKSLNGFKEAVDQVNILKNQIRVLQKEHAVSVLEHFMHHHPDHEPYYREQTALLPEEALLQVFCDETRYLQLRCKAVEVLADRKSIQLVSPLLEFLNSVVDSDDDWGLDIGTDYCARDLVNSLAQIGTLEAYQGLKEFLNLLLKKDPKYKIWFLTWTAFALADISVELDKSDSVSMLSDTVSLLDVGQHEHDSLKDLAGFFDKFNEPEGIKKILNEFVKDAETDIEDLEKECLELLKNHDSGFVTNWELNVRTPRVLRLMASKNNDETTANTQNKESS